MRASEGGFHDAHCASGIHFRALSRFMSYAEDSH